MNAAFAFAFHLAVLTTFPSRRVLDWYGGAGITVCSVGVGYRGLLCLS
ncbi:hypothetical protein COMA1_20689 [Candidatus Nitrospira nitrosa]|uniref:Uncharacterized protein n=1 Tax=Candidatus Nitrospira nitrosa TaxID=1742972 RepID=A0A0S4LHK0_9BACT|nr:hypothetical protein COMA1_20689 [Candidatus Nitrospira nitrosa]